MLGEPRAVARGAGVSRQTASRVIENIDGISHQTLDYVRAAFACLRHHPTSIATQSILTVGLVIPDTANPLLADISTRPQIVYPPTFEGGREAAMQLLTACSAIDALPYFTAAWSR